MVTITGKGDNPIYSGMYNINKYIYIYIHTNIHQAQFSMLFFSFAPKKMVPGDFLGPFFSPLTGGLLNATFGNAVVPWQGIASDRTHDRDLPQMVVV